MRVMVILQASEASEQGVLPTEEAMREMMAFNEEVTNAGIMLAGEGLTASSQGARVVFDGNKTPVVVDGPFAETKELIAGFWIWQVKSLEEAIEWAKKIPNTEGEQHAVEIRRLFSPEDFGDAMKPDIVAKIEELSAKGGNYAAEKA